MGGGTGGSTLHGPCPVRDHWLRLQRQRCHRLPRAGGWQGVHDLMMSCDSVPCPYWYDLQQPDFAADGTDDRARDIKGNSRIA